MMFELDKEILEDFISECTDMLDQVEPALLSSKALDKALADKLFRPIHSVKGSAASLGFNVLAGAVHWAENLLTFFRDKGFATDDQRFLTCFLNFFDFIRKVLAELAEKKTDVEFKADGERLTAEVKLLLEVVEATLDGKPLPEAFANPAKDISISQSTVDLDLSEPKIETSSAQVATEEGQDESNIVIELGQEMIDAFTGESEESLTLVEQNLLALAKDPENRSMLQESFRNMHSFKGNCGIFSLADLEKLSHRLESVFQKILDNTIIPNRGIFEAILPIVDVLKSSVRNLDTKNTHVEGLDLYLEILDGLQKSKEAETAPSETLKPLFTSPSSTSTPSLATTSTPVLDVKSTETKVATAPTSAIKAPSKTATEGGDKARQDIRVDIEKLDHLNNLVGELVTAKTMIYELKHEYGGSPESFEKVFRFLDRVTSELHDSAMNIRMVPIAALFKRMIRIVHDISVKSNKKVDFVYFGEETEVDKTLVEKISDPLVHMIRNAVDHGVEPEEERIRVGKPPVGRVTLEAKNEAGEVWIIIKDDGRGLNKEKLLKKAIEKGIISESDTLTDKEIYELIFAAGFSTAEKVTDISGRGVGMDVVRQNILSLKGKVDISSVLGAGTTFTIKIPLTLAIIAGMVVRVGDMLYSLPIECIKESMKVTASMLTKPLEGNELVKIRNHMLPVIRLADVYDIKGATRDIEEGVLVIVEARGKQVAILVDQLVGQKETVVKPLPKYFKNVKGIAGCSITGTGEASLILDTASLLELVQEGHMTNGRAEEHHLA